MSEHGIGPYSPLPEEKLSPHGGSMLPFGLRMERVTGEDGKRRRNAVIDERDPALEADLHTFFQIILKEVGSENLDQEVRAAGAGSLAPNTGALLQSLQAYAAVSEQLLGTIFEDEPIVALPAELLRTAFENYPFFYNGEQVAQGSGLSMWDKTLEPEPGDAGKGNQ